MSIDLMSRIPDRTDLDSYEKLVMLILCDRADPDDGLLWYANETIAHKCSMTIRGVQKVLDRLIAMGLVSKMRRHDRSNFYIVNIENLPRVERPAKPSKERGPVEYLMEEPDLFGDRGEHGSRRRHERGSIRHEPRSDRHEHGSPDSLSDPEETPESSPDDLLCRYVVDQWERLVDDYPDLAGFGALDDERARGIVRRTDEHRSRKASQDDRTALWAGVFATIRSSKLCLGMSTEWSITSDWLLKKANFKKVVENKYGNGRDRVGTEGRSDRSAISAGQDALGLVRSARERSGRTAYGAG
jgi:hypothetical protein